MNPTGVYRWPVPSRFTIAVPTHNRRETLLLAVRSALMQTLGPEQVIVLCDGCTDGSAPALSELEDERVEALELPKLPGYAYGHRNLALERARGQWILWLGDDDLLLPDHLERIDECLERAPADLDLVQTPAAVVWKDDTMSWVGLDWSVAGHVSTLMDRNTNVMASIAVRVAAARAAGGWNPALPRFGDWDLWKRVLAAGARTSMTDEPTLLHFRATDRNQPWEDRVAQNRAWFACVTDPQRVRELRPRLRRLRAEREAHWMARIDDLEADAGRLGEELRRRADELDSRGEEIERLRESERTLARIYDGGWWRLRALLLPVLQRASRMRGRRA